MVSWVNSVGITMASQVLEDLCTYLVVDALDDGNHTEPSLATFLSVIVGESHGLATSWSKENIKGNTDSSYSLVVRVFSFDYWVCLVGAYLEQIINII